MSKWEWFEGRKKFGATWQERSEWRYNIVEKMDREGEPRKIEPGPKKIILEAYEKNGKNGAMLALRILNKRLGKVVYSWSQVERWIKENKKTNVKFEKGEREIDD